MRNSVAQLKQDHSDLCGKQTLFKFVKEHCDKIENVIPSEVNDKFNQEVFKAIDKIRNK